LANRQRNDERHRRGEAGPRVAVSSQCDSATGIEQSTRVRIRRAGGELDAWQQGRDRLSGGERVDVGATEVAAVVDASRAELDGEPYSWAGRQLVAVHAQLQAGSPSRKQDRAGLITGERVRAGRFAEHVH